MEDFAKKIGRMVRFHRKKARLSQKELAEFSEIGKTAVFDIEKGKPTVRLSTLLAVLSILNIRMKFGGPLMDRFGEEDEKG